MNITIEEKNELLSLVCEAMDRREQKQEGVKWILYSPPIPRTGWKRSHLHEGYTLPLPHRNRN